MVKIKQGIPGWFVPVEYFLVATVALGAMRAMMCAGEYVLASEQFRQLRELEKAPSASKQFVLLDTTGGAHYTRQGLIPSKPAN